MGSDSPYRLRDLALTPLQGAGAGVLASVLMMAMIGLLQPVSGTALTTLLRHVAAILPGAALGSAGAGAGIVLVAGAVLGLLYAACQQHAPARGLVAVGIFYGVFLWAVGNLVARLSLGEALSGELRSIPWLAACLIYGLCLGGTAAAAERLQPAQTVALKD